MASTMNAKKIINNTNGKEVWKIKNNANDKIAFMKKWTFTINMGDYVSAIEYSTDNSNWTTSGTTTTVLTMNYDQTLYVKAKTYVPDDDEHYYTPYNFSFNVSHLNDGGSITIYQQEHDKIYESTITAGDYVSTVRAKVNDGSWTNADSSVSVTHKYRDTVTYEAVTYDTTYESGTTKYIYEGATSSSFSNSTNRSVTLNRTQRLQYYLDIRSVNCTTNISTGWHDAPATIIWTANPNYAFSSDGSTTTQSVTVNSAPNSSSHYSREALYVYVSQLVGTHCSTDASIGWKHIISDYITWTADEAYSFSSSSNNSSTITFPVAGVNTASADYVKRYVLTISTTNGSYGTYSVSRTSSPYANASIGTLANGSTIYYGDVLSGSSTPNNPTYGAWDVENIAPPTVTSTGAATKGNMTITNNHIGFVAINYNTINSITNSTGAGILLSGATTTLSNLSFGTTYYVFASGLRNRPKTTYIASNDNYTGTNGVSADVTATFEFSSSTSTDSETITSVATQHTTANINTYTLTISVQNPNYASSYSVTRTASPYGASTGALSNGATLYYGDELSCSATAKSKETTWDVDSLNPPIISGTKKNSSSYYTTYIENNDATNGLTLYRNTNGGSGGTSVWVIDDENPYETISVSNCSYGTTYYYNVGGDISGTIYTYSVSTGWSTKTVNSNVTATINYSISTQSTSKRIYSSNVSKSLSYVPTKDDFYVECSTEDDGADENYYKNYLSVKNNFPSSVTIRHSVNGSAELTSSSNSYSSGQTRSFSGSWCEDTIDTITLAVTYSGSTYTFTYTGSDRHFYWR